MMEVWICDWKTLLRLKRKHKKAMLNLTTGAYLINTSC